jgi:hypothetical protein
LIYFSDILILLFFFFPKGNNYEEGKFRALIDGHLQQGFDMTTGLCQVGENLYLSLPTYKERIHIVFIVISAKDAQAPNARGVYSTWFSSIWTQLRRRSKVIQRKENIQFGQNELL